MIPHEEYIEFDLKALCFYMLRKWKLILIFGLVFALALGGFQVSQVRKSHQNPNAESTYQKEYALYAADAARITALIDYTQSSVDGFQEYVDNSVLMKIDHQNVNTASATYFVNNPYPFLTSDQEAGTGNALVWHYSNCLGAYEIHEKIAAAAGMEPRYVPELVTITIPNEYSLVVSVIHTSQETAVQILQILQESLEEIHLQLTETLGEHTIAQTSGSVSVCIDTNLHIKQRDTLNHLSNLKVNLAAHNNELRALPVPHLPAMPDLSDVFVKWTILGGLIGAAAALALVFLFSILRNRLHAGSQLVSAFHIPLLGEAICSRAKLPFLSRKINGLEGCLQENSEANYRILAENITHACKDAKNLLVCSDTPVRDDLLQALTPHLEQIRLLPAADLLKNAESLHMLEECDGVVMISSRDRSRISVIRKIMAKVQSYEKDVIGFIMTY